MKWLRWAWAAVVAVVLGAVGVFVFRSRALKAQKVAAEAKESFERERARMWKQVQQEAKDRQAALVALQKAQAASRRADEARIKANEIEHKLRARISDAERARRFNERNQL